jgi:signal transduction histidine kinase
MRYIFWSLFCLPAIGSVSAKTPVIDLPDADTSFTVWNRSELLEDPTGQFRITDSHSLPPPASFSSTAGRNSQLGFSSADFWLRFRLRNDSSATPRLWIIYLPYFFANRLTLFVIDETTGIVTEHQTGAGIPLNSWSIPYQEGACRLPLQSNRTYTLLLRLSGSNSKPFSPIVSEIKRYYQFTQTSAYILALYFGLLLFALLLQILFYSINQERNFLLYAFYLAGLFFVVVQGGNGLPGEVYIWFPNDWLYQNGMTLASSFCSVAALLFYAGILDLNRHARWLSRLFQLIMFSVIVSVIVFVVGQLNEYGTQYAVFLGTIHMLLVFTACIVSLANGFPLARYYWLATLSLLAAMVTLSLWHEGLIPINTFTTYCFPIGSSGEVIFFTLALAKDYHQKQLKEKQAQQKLIQTLQTYNQEITSAHLQGQTLERQRVAADLHDNLGTTLSALHWNLEAMDKSRLTATEQVVYANISQQVSQAYTDVRLLSHNLLPDELAKQGLVVALRNLVGKLNRNTRVHFSVTGTETLPRFDPKTEFEVYSICLELLNNTLKHASATEGVIELARENDNLYLTVSDNGTGLGHQEEKEGRGLQNVAARVQSLAGTWSVDSEPAKGVRHQITVPVKAMNRVG